MKGRTVPNNAMEEWTAKCLCRLSDITPVELCSLPELWIVADRLFKEHADREPIELRTSGTATVVYRCGLGQAAVHDDGWATELAAAVPYAVSFNNLQPLPAARSGRAGPAWSRRDADTPH